jgi:gliding motility-associated-like protein
MKTRLPFIALFLFLFSFSASAQLEQLAAEEFIKETIENAPTVFRENKGQWDTEIKYKTHFGDNNIYFLNDGLSFGVRQMYDAPKRFDDEGNLLPPNPDDRPKAAFLVWDMKYVNMNDNATWSTDNGVTTKVGYYTGSNGDAPKLGIKEFQKIRHNNVYNNIDVEYYIRENKLKYDYHLHSGADIKDIQLKFNGIDELSINSAGELIIRTEWGNYTKELPYSYQVIDGVEKEVNVQFTLLKEENAYGYKIIGDYDPNYELVIDPIYVDWSTYFKGDLTSTAWSVVYDVEVDENDYVYVGGYTSDRFPVKPGSYDTSHNGGMDGYICKFKIDGSDLVWFNYIGGSSTDYVLALAATNKGSIYATGYTTSNDFPTTSGAYQRNFGTSTQASFIIGMNTDGKSLIYSTYIGTNGWAWGQALDVNEKGEVFLGLFYRNGNLPVLNYILPQQYYSTATSGQNGFVLKMKSDGSGLLNSTLYGGNGTDYVYGIYVDESDNVYIAGYTTSTNLYVTWGVGNYGTSINGAADGFFVKIDAAFSKFEVAKYVGGSGTDNIMGIYGSEDGIYISMYTNSADIINRTNNISGSWDAAVLKIRPNGIKPEWTTYIGGNNFEWPRGITANIKEEAIIVGQTGSTNFPVTSDAKQGKHGGGFYDAFVTKLDYNGKLSYSSFIGGSSWEYFWGVTTKKIGCVSHIVMGGWTNSANFPTTKGAWKETRGTTGTFWTGAVVKMRDTLKLAEIDLGPDDIYCDNILTTLDGQNHGATYRWSTGDTTKRIKVRDSGTYWVNATYGCGYEYDTIHIGLERSPRKVLPKDTIYCDNFTRVLDAINDTIPKVSYKWNTNETTQKITVNKEGKYTVEINTENCGKVIDDIELIQIKAPVVDLGKDTVVCGAFSDTLDAGNKDELPTYAWNFGDSLTRIGQKIGINDTGYYKVVVTNVCGADSSDIFIDLDSLPSFEIPADSTFCDQVDLTFSHPEVSIYTSLTTSGNFNSEYTQNGESFYEVKDDGNYWIEQKNQCGTEKKEFNATLYYTPTVDLPADTILCDNETITYTVGKSANAESYLWTPTLSLQKSLTVTTAGKYYVQIDNYCGTAKDSVQVNYLETPTVFLGIDSVFCNNVNIQLDAENMNNDVTYTWTTNENTQIITVDKTGTYGVTVANKCGSFYDEIVLDMIETPKVNLGDDRIFCGSAFPTQTLDAGNEDNDVSYMWSTNETSKTISTTTANVYKVVVLNKCGADSSEMEIVLSPFPAVDLGKDTFFCGRFEYELDAGNPGSTYSWTPSLETGQTAVLTEYGEHTVLVTNEYGCESTDRIFIENTCDTRFYLPNAFTPDGDLHNPIFTPVIKDILQIDFAIYNRWGEKMFHTTTVGEGWDGTFKGEPCPQGVYLYVITYQGARLKEHIRGDVTLLRNNN